jgi:hypothetical protein
MEEVDAIAHVAIFAERPLGVFAVDQVKRGVAAYVRLVALNGREVDPHHRIVAVNLPHPSPNHSQFYHGPRDTGSINMSAASVPLVARCVCA